MRDSVLILQKRAN